MRYIEHFELLVNYYHFVKLISWLCVVTFSKEYSKCTWKIRIHHKCSILLSYVKLTLPFLTASRASSTQCWTFADIQRYLKNLWCADQNWPHMLFFILCSASMSSAALLNRSLAVTHWREKIQYLSIIPFSVSGRTILIYSQQIYWFDYQYYRQAFFFSFCIVGIKTYHSNTVIVDLDKIFIQRNFLNSKCDAFKTQLSGNVHSS